MSIVPIIASMFTRESLRRQCLTFLQVVSVAFTVPFGGAALHAQDELSLHDALEQAKNSPAVLAADATVAAARGSVRQAGLGLNPKLFLQSEDLRPWASNFSFTNQTEDYGYLGQTIETDGKRRKRVALAEARLHEAEANRALKLRGIYGKVASAYWAAVSSQRVLELLREDLKAADEIVRYHKERVDAGAARGVDLLRMQIEKDRLVIALQAAEREAAQARLELFRQMGKAVETVTLTDKLESIPVYPPVALSEALNERPDVAAARYAVEAAKADLKLQKAGAYPDPDILVGYKRNSSDDTLFAGLQISLPVRNRNQGEIERAQAQVNVAEAFLKLLENEVAIQIQQAQANFDAQNKIVHETLPDMRSKAEQNLKIITEAYRIGGVDLLRLIDAERTEFEVEVSAAQALVQLQQNAVQLQLAYGVQP